jgi:hypothetical protein
MRDVFIPVLVFFALVIIAFVLVLLLVLLLSWGFYFIEPVLQWYKSLFPHEVVKCVVETC